MDAYGDLIHDTHQPLDKVPSAEFNSVARILDSQVVGALRGIGAGVAEETAWTVAAGTGLSVDIAAGCGIARDGDLWVWLKTDGAYNLSVPASSATYVYARAVTRVDAGDPDSRESGVVEWHTNSTGEAVAGALLIAKVVTDGNSVTDVTDLRTWSRGLEALLTLAGEAEELDEIREAIGLQYFGESAPPVSLDARVDDLEAAGGDGGTGPVYWKDLKRAAGDATTIDQRIDHDVQEHVDQYHQDEEEGDSFVVQAEPWDEDSVNQARHALRATRQTDAGLPAVLIDTLVVCWGIYGDGSGTSPDFIDRINSTWLPT